MSEELVVMKEILKWLRFLAFPQLKKTLEETLKKDEEKLAYDLSDGTLSSPEIAKKANVSDVTVRTYWKNWFKLGIVESSEKYKTRMKKIVSLDEISIEIQKMATKASKKQEKASELEGIGEENA